MRALILLAISFAAAAGEPITPPKPRDDAKERAAVEAFKEVEDQLAEWRKLPPAEREKKEAGLESRLERLVERTRETRQENKALFWLAQWRLANRGGAKTEELLAELDRLDYPAFKSAGRALRVQLLLKQGKLADARRVAEEVAATVPEFRGVLDLVAFHERVGRKAPRTAGRPLGGGLPDPAARPEPWLVYCFLPGTDAESLHRLRALLAELRHESYAGSVRAVAVVFAANPLQAASDLAALEGAGRLDLLWANPAPDGDGAQWMQDWGSPPLPANALLAADRTIASVNIEPQELRVLVGRKRDDRPATSPGSGAGSVGPKGTGGGKAPWER